MRNANKLRISFARNKAIFEPIRVHGKELELVDNAKLLGLTITSDLSWNTHVNDVIKKAAKRLYFSVQLKRAKVPCNDLGLCYITCVRSVLDYAIPVYYYSLPKYLVNELERAQMRALKIMCPSLSYDEALTHMEIAPLSVHHSNICATLFNEILSDSDHRLHPKMKENVPRCLKAKNKTNFCRKLQIMDTSDRKQMATRWSPLLFQALVPKPLQTLRNHVTILTYRQTNSSTANFVWAKPTQRMQESYNLRLDTLLYLI